MIEVEKKFALSKEQETRLLENAKFIAEVENHDIYFDNEQCELTTQSIWLRKRNGSFEMKVKVPSQERTEYAQYTELETEAEILEFLGIETVNIKDFEELLAENGYNPFAQYKTRRHRYKKEGFTIDVDKTDFGHEMIEIELLVSTEDEIEKAGNSILEFAKDHGLNADYVRGKLSAYLKIHNLHHLQRLVNVGAIRES
jgi:predicted adenylyl cyclase CyaB